ncbi:MAG: RDD family protein [Hyphomicrobiaceae bacterium]|nr:RDD family protein [Hyphomicrobiaceae bacterium]
MAIEPAPNQAPRDVSFEAADKPHAYDPVTQSEYFEGVLGRRVMAFIIDVVIIFALTILAYVFLLVAGIFTLGLAWLLFGLAFPVIALTYNAITLSGPQSATIGMRATDLQMRTWYGAPMYALLAAFHAVLYYVSVVFLTPFVLLIAPFNARKRCLHDFLAGTVVINSDERADLYRRL